MRTIRRFGWVPDLPDRRDRRFTVPRPGVFPEKVDLGESVTMPPVFDQKQTGSCTGQSCAGIVQFMHAKEALAAPQFSALFLYYNGRVLEESEAWDMGASIRDVIKSINSEGACEETIWPFDEDKVTVKPSPESYASGLNHLSVEYLSLGQDLSELKTCLVQGFPFVFGFTVYESFESGPCRQFGLMPMPKPDESTMGGHAVWCYGYDDEHKTFKVRNSWGRGWGSHGNFFMPYDYATNPGLAADFWAIKLIT